MFGVGIALMAATVLVFLLSESARDYAGLTLDQVGQIGFFVLLLLLFIGGGSRRLRLGEFARNLAIWAGLFVTLILGYSYRNDIEAVAQRVIGELRPGVTATSANGEVIVRANLNGSFEVLGRANDTRTLFLFDTGASSVVLTYDDARNAGIDVENLRFSIPVNTANGTGRAAAGRLNSLSINDISRRNVRVLVAERGRLDISLLGTSFLETLESYTVRGAQLILRD